MSSLAMTSPSRSSFVKSSGSVDKLLHHDRYPLHPILSQDYTSPSANPEIIVAKEHAPASMVPIVASL
jgi:hypothetical protein